MKPAWGRSAPAHQERFGSHKNLTILNYFNFTKLSRQKFKYNDGSQTPLRLTGMSTGWDDFSCLCSHRGSDKRKSRSIEPAVAPALRRGMQMGSIVPGGARASRAKVVFLNEASTAARQDPMRAGLSVLPPPESEYTFYTSNSSAASSPSLSASSVSLNPIFSEPFAGQIAAASKIVYHRDNFICLQNKVGNRTQKIPAPDDGTIRFAV